MRRPLLLSASVLAAGALLVSCGDDDTTSSSAEHAAHGGSTPVRDGARRIDVTAESFEFDPAEITAAAGEDLAIVLTSEDILHDFTIDELDAHVAAAGGKTQETGLRPGEAGTYTYYCSVAGHRKAGMEGTLVVE